MRKVLRVATEVTLKTATGGTKAGKDADEVCSASCYLLNVKPNGNSSHREELPGEGVRMVFTIDPSG